MFVEQSSNEPTQDIQTQYSLDQSINIDNSYTSKQTQGHNLQPNQYLNQLLESSTFSPEKQTTKRIAQNKIKLKKIKQKLNYLSELIIEQNLLKDPKDLTSPNKSRLLKIVIELDKAVRIQAIDYQLVQSILKQIQKIIEHKRQHDIIILRGARFMPTLMVLIKRFPSLHRTEAAQSMLSLELSLRLLRIMLCLSTSRQLLLMTNQMTGISTLLSCVLMRDDKKIALACLYVLNMILGDRIRIQLNQIINANIQYMLCSSLLKRLKCCIQNNIVEEDASSIQFLLLGFKFYYLVLSRCCQKELDRPIYGTPVMDNLSRAFSGFFESGIQMLVGCLIDLLFEKEGEEQGYSLRDQEIGNGKINILLYLFKCLNVIFHVNVTFVQKIIECNSILMRTILFVFKYTNSNFKQNNQIKKLGTEIVVFIGNLSCQNQLMQNIIRQSNIIPCFCDHPMQYRMEPLKHIFMSAFCCLIHQNPPNFNEVFKKQEYSVIPILKYIQKQITSSYEKKIEDQPCMELGVPSTMGQCKTLSRKTSVSSMNSLNSAYSKTSMAQSYSTQASSASVFQRKQVRLDYKFRNEFWEEMVQELRQIDD